MGCSWRLLRLLCNFFTSVNRWLKKMSAADESTASCSRWRKRGNVMDKLGEARAAKKAKRTADDSVVTADDSVERQRNTQAGMSLEDAQECVDDWFLFLPCIVLSAVFSSSAILFCTIVLYFLQYCFYIISSDRLFAQNMYCTECSFFSAILFCSIVLYFLQYCFYIVSSDRLFVQKNVLYWVQLIFSLQYCFDTVSSYNKCIALSAVYQVFFFNTVFTSSLQIDSSYNKCTVNENIYTQYFLM